MTDERIFRRNFRCNGGLMERMDEDEAEGDLLEQFSCMQTLDRDDLVQQMVRLVGENINIAAAKFYLEMNQWNVQSAVGAYFDLELANSTLPGMIFVRDVTVGEGESVPPNTRFVKTWRVQNPGPEPWPPGCVLRYVDGAVLSLTERVVAGPLDPYLSTEISVNMTSPAQPGLYQSKWRMSTATGSFFGDVIWVILSVEEAGTLSITQQFDSLDQLGTRVDSSSGAINRNPFGSPQQLQ